MRILIISLLTFLSITAGAQNYTRDAGIRVGDYFSATYRMFIEEDQAFEGMFFIGRHGATFTILKEQFIPALGQISENLRFEFGYGAHVGFRYTDHYKVLNRTYDLGDYRMSPLLGIDGLVGIEYRFPDLPVVMSIDIKPYFEYSTIQIFDLYLQSIGISIKYRF
jgi:hypothetical protein